MPCWKLQDLSYELIMHNFKEAWANLEADTRSINLTFERAKNPYFPQNLCHGREVVS